MFTFPLGKVYTVHKKSNSVTAIGRRTFLYTDFKNKIAVYNIHVQLTPLNPIKAVILKLKDKK
jgi:hypothetical protein